MPCAHVYRSIIVNVDRTCMHASDAMADAPTIINHPPMQYTCTQAVVCMHMSIAAPILCRSINGKFLVIVRFSMMYSLLRWSSQHNDASAHCGCHLIMCRSAHRIHGLVRGLCFVRWRHIKRHRSRIHHLNALRRVQAGGDAPRTPSSPIARSCDFIFYSSLWLMT